MTDDPEDYADPLPRSAVVFADHSYPAFSRAQMLAAIAQAHAAGRAEGLEEAAKVADVVVAQMKVATDNPATAERKAMWKDRWWGACASVSAIRFRALQSR